MDTAAVKSCVLWIVGTPLDENAELSVEAKAALRQVSLVVGESRSVTSRFLKQAGVDPGVPVYFLDPPRPAEMQATLEAISAERERGGSVALLSDTGMPIAFDPGADILAHCRRQGFTVRSVPAPTSWGTACALSGFPAPYHVVGFPPRDTAERDGALRGLRDNPATLVLMDTPYRFRLLLKNASEAFGRDREAFLAWEIASPKEQLLWGTVDGLVRQAQARSMEKGEFILVLGPLSRPVRPHPQRPRRHRR